MHLSLLWFFSFACSGVVFGSIIDLFFFLIVFATENLGRTTARLVTKTIITRKSFISGIYLKLYLPLNSRTSTIKNLDGLGPY